MQIICSKLGSYLKGNKFKYRYKRRSFNDVLRSFVAYSEPNEPIKRSCGREASVFEYFTADGTELRVKIHN
jgi:hypothetical protein